MHLGMVGYLYNMVFFPSIYSLSCKFEMDVTHVSLALSAVVISSQMTQWLEYEM